MPETGHFQSKGQILLGAMPFVLPFAPLCFVKEVFWGQNGKNRLWYCNCVDNNQSPFSGSPDKAGAVENLTDCWWRTEFVMK